VNRWQAALQNQNVQAFLHMIRVGEGTADADGYRRRFGGAMLADLSDHPRNALTAGLGAKRYISSASGAYQFLTQTWNECAKALDLKDFSPASQDVAAVWLIDRRKALDDVLAGRTEAAIAKCAREWASLPGSPYGQPTKTLAQALTAYRTRLGQIAPADVVATSPPPPPVPAAAPAATPSETAMPLPAIVAALLPVFLQKIPELVGLANAKGDERKEQAIQLAVQVATDAIGAKNAQEAAEIIAADPKAADQARQAVQEQWLSITEVGGGISAARQANAAGQPPPGRNVALWVTAALLPLVYMTVGAVVFADGWPAEVRAMVVAAVVTGVLGGVTGYWLGTSASSARKTELQASSAG